MKLNSDEIPILFDDGDKTSLLNAYTLQLERLQNNSTNLTIAGDEYSNEWMIDSFSYFIQLIKEYSGEELQERLIKEFTIYQSTGLNNITSYDILSTGYFEPTFLASKTKQDEYIYPLYSLPSDIVQIDEDSKKIAKRKTKEGLKPYWSREEIEEGQYLTGQEIAYLTDPIDVFVLHIQGSGKLRFQDGSTRSFQYAGNNGHGYKSIGALLIKENKLSREETNMESIRAYLNLHPNELKQILHYNPRYIFFRDAGNKPIVGSASIPLTPMRSIAIDEKSLPWQLPILLSSSFPHFSETGLQTKMINRFLVAQDTGSAIKGFGRIDLFCGSGEIARRTASHMKEKGSLYFLVRTKLP
ncbi:MAG: MltA domain-containing protein [Desulfotalea sp.]